MISSNYGDLKSPAILVVQDSQTKLISDSTIVNSFNRVYMSVSKNLNILAWIQENQPDLIILNLEWSKINELGLITALKLDWLTRNIPVMTIGDRRGGCNANCDACLLKPYSRSELDKIICSLVSSGACWDYVG